ncbi:CdaR family transcriptional regulator [Anaerobacterium chartisolvens]|uniref:CdaR family transcriptional regulator n=1 Tax=Anaerobacterium chartisolvens TaxID=1297424 RepID=A0A369BCM4_9FIRM|nr:helix-turn-helix domain-containing protein [Anaerobacterium chartisolvens]RCX18326.1 CdaR family transcriptional regulator [Anaerobacterium chartisolvens]
MSKKLFQNLMCQVQEIIDEEVGLINDSGLVIACSSESRIGQEDSLIQSVISSKDDLVVIDNISFKKIYIKGKLEFIAFILSNSEMSQKYLSLMAINIINIKTYYDEKFDRSNFLKNVINGRILAGDVQIKAKELHIMHNAWRTVFLINTGKNQEVYAHEVIQELFPNRLKDFIIVLDDENIVLIKEIKNNEDFKETDKIAQAIVDTLNTESMVKAMIGIGTAVDSIMDIGRSFREAQTALKVGAIFENDKYIINYNNLGIGRLIYKLPEQLCRLFLKEVFKNGSFESLDAEYILTIQKFFENNLNVSETSRQMFVHRNTLVYRMDKIQKVTGLDITKFDDAIILKFAMLVKRYLDKGQAVLQMDGLKEAEDGENL